MKGCGWGGGLRRGSRDRNWFEISHLLPAEDMLLARSLYHIPSLGILPLLWSVLSPKPCKDILQVDAAENMHHQTIQGKELLSHPSQPKAGQS